LLTHFIYMYKISRIQNTYYNIKFAYIFLENPNSDSAITIFTFLFNKSFNDTMFINGLNENFNFASPTVKIKVVEF